MPNSYIEEIPEKEFYPLSRNAVCPQMKMHTLEKVRRALEQEEPEVLVRKDVAEKYQRLEDIMTIDVIISELDEPIERAVEKLEAHNISALPVLNHERRVIGMLTSEGISKLVGWCRWR